MSLLVEKSLKSFLTPKYVEIYVEMYRYKAVRTEQKGNGWCVSESTLLLSRNQENHFIYPFDPWTLGCSLFLKSDINCMDIKPCVLFTELGGLVVESLVFYIDINTPRPTYFRGKMID